MGQKFPAEAPISGIISLISPRLHLLNIIQPEEHHFPEAVVVAQQILPAALGADEDFQGADRVDNRTVGSALVDMSDLNRLFPADGSQQLQQNPAASRFQTGTDTSRRTGSGSPALCMLRHHVEDPVCRSGRSHPRQ